MDKKNTCQTCVWVNQNKARWILSVSLFQTLKQTHCLFCSWFVRHGSFGLLHAGKTACIAWPSDGGSSKLRPLVSNMENASLLLFFSRLRCRTLLLIFSFFILSFSSVLFLFCSYLTFSVHEFCLDVLWTCFYQFPYPISFCHIWSSWFVILLTSLMLDPPHWSHYPTSCACRPT